MKRRIQILVAVCATLLLPQLTSAETYYFDGPIPRIVNGLTTQDYPTTGALLLGGNPATAVSHCTGTLIGCETFLTAAHCVEDDINPASYTVFLQHGGFSSVSQIDVPAAYAFPVADLAVLKLSVPMSGIAPAPIDTTGGHGLGSPGTIVGFGRTGGGALDYGLKRFGAVAIAPCLFGVSDTTSICWDFDSPHGPAGSDSNTCNADSGGPLFIDAGGGPVVAGITSGGNSGGCMPFDNSFDTRVSYYASDIQAFAGADINNTSCGSEPHVGDPDVDVFSFEDSLDGSVPQRMHTFTVSQGALRLRTTFNGEDNGLTDFNLYLRHGSPPTTASYDCRAAGAGQFGECEFDNPAGGVWYALIVRISGSGTYQITATSFGSFCSDPGNDGLACDDGNSCTTGETCQSSLCVGTPVVDGSVCNDGNACTTPDTCEAGVCVGQVTCGDGIVQVACEECDDGATLSGDGCDDTCSVEPCYQCGGEPSVCAPPNGCKVPFKSVLVINHQTSNPSKNKVVWKWLKGTSTFTDFGDPLASDDYSMCVWEDGVLVSRSHVTPGGMCGSKPCWKETGSVLSPTGFKFKNKSTNGDGVLQTNLKVGFGSAKILWKGRGANLMLPGAANGFQYFDGTSVVVQATRDDGGVCWRSEFSPADFKKNESSKFKAVR